MGRQNLALGGLFAALGRRSGGGNAFFGGGGQRNDFWDSEYEPDSNAAIGDAIESETGMNPSAIHNIAMDELDDRDKENEVDRVVAAGTGLTREQAAAGQKRQQDLTGPGGQAYTSPQERDLAFAQNRAPFDRQKLAADLASKGAAEDSAYWSPSHQSRLEQEQTFKNNPIEMKLQNALEVAGVKHQGEMEKVQATEESKHRDAIARMYQTLGAKTDKRGKPVFSPDQIHEIQQSYDTNNPGRGSAPGTNGGVTRTLGETDIQAAMHANGWTREQAVQAARAKGYAVN